MDPVALSRVTGALDHVKLGKKTNQTGSNEANLVEFFLFATSCWLLERKSRYEGNIGLTDYSNPGTLDAFRGHAVSKIDLGGHTLMKRRGF